MDSRSDTQRAKPWYLPFTARTVTAVAEGGKRAALDPCGRFTFARYFKPGGSFEMHAAAGRIRLRVRIVAARHIDDLRQLPHLGLTVSMFGTWHSEWDDITRLAVEGLARVAAFKQRPIESLLRRGWMVVVIEPAGDIERQQPAP